MDKEEVIEGLGRARDPMCDRNKTRSNDDAVRVCSVAREPRAGLVSGSSITRNFAHWLNREL